MKTATAPPEALEAELGLDLWALIDALGVPVEEAVQVTTIPAVDGLRGSFRVTLADGQILKARRLRTPTDVERVTRLSSLLDPQFFPPVLAHRGCGLLTRWIPGASIRGGDWTSTYMRTCGGLHATIHRLPVPAESAPLWRRSPTGWEQRLDELLDELVGRRALDVRQARAVRHLAGAAAPASHSTAVCHRDFCGDNIILSDAGQVCVIDNEGIAVDSPEYDLARTWYRWPMTASQHGAYAEGYGAHEHVARFAAHFLHWALIVLVESAAFRTRVGAASAQLPLERLTRLLRTRGQNESFPRALSCR
jgi:aminoglycoside phosphotransferase